MDLVNMPPIFTRVIILLIVTSTLYLYFLSLRWLHRDAKKRMRNSLRITIAVAVLFWPLGLLIWVIFRPALKLKRRSGSGMQSCAHCQRMISVLVALCPYCGKIRTRAQ
ncbi:MAG: hypothetical protein ABIP97_09095 [Chthoniobacterales bacterium]